MENNSDYYDVLTTDGIQLEKNVLDGVVVLCDVLPRIVPFGRTMEYRIAQSARISYGAELRSISADEKLIQYMAKHNHTSPSEQLEFVFLIEAPLFVRDQMFRHRTANVNCLSLRYTPMLEQRRKFFKPSQHENGIRFQNDVNKQSSVIRDVSEEVKTKIEEMESLVDQIYDKYEEVVNLGVAKECARFALPSATYTQFYFKLDLHNLMHFFRLRTAPDCQHETRLYAQAMFDLIEPLVPITMSVFKNKADSITLSPDEVDAIKNRNDNLNTKSVSEKKAYKEKMDKLNLLVIDNKIY